MADFKTTLERLSRQEIEFDSVAKNITKLLQKKPQAAVTVMDQLKEAVTEEVIEPETYARLKALVAAHLELPVGHGDGEERTVFAGDSDATEVFDLTGAGANPDQTMILSGDETQIQDPTAAGVAMSGQTTGIDFDLTSDSGSSSSWPTGDSQTGQTGTDWAQPAPGAATTRLGPGAVLRGRFQLDEVLGVGGMGSVYLGSDLIKVRAKDKQPRVALKVLNEDFKQHPDSFIALQREASRQQKLAHPNIATVYDFDQTEDGLAFLVMEVLEGQALNDYIKKVVKPKGGLPFEEALPMVQGLGAALVYAHDHNIVHSDFKPGNCFITKDGQMKVLDFGIARAVKAPGAAEGETTIFDPGKLGALTPAYASVEMLEGEEPDTRDDIYALACVAYELLTGKHPFNKIPANKARDSGLAPEPIKTITRKQWRGLERGLAFKREDRSQSTAEFLEEFEGATSPFKNPLIMVPAAVALIVLAGFFPAKNYLEEQDLKERITLAQSGDPATIETVLSGLETDAIEAARRDRVLTQAKDQILDYFDNKARGQIDIAGGQYDFTGARQTLATAKAYGVYADSSKLAALQEHIDETENLLFNEQFEKFNNALAEGNLLKRDDQEDIHDAMAVVRKVDPNHPMLHDRRIPGAFANAINEALENEDYEYADELGNVGVGLIPGNANLANLTDKIAGAKDRAETNLRILRAVAEIEAVKSSGAGLAAYSQAGDAVADLAAADPANPLLQELRDEIGPQATRDITALESSRKWGDSALMGGNFKGLLRGLGLHDINARALALGDEFDSVVADARAAVTSAVAAGEIEAPAATQVSAMAAVAPHSPRTQNARDQVAKARLTAAQKARAAGNFAAAKQSADAAMAIAPSDVVRTSIEAEAARIAGDSTLDTAALQATLAERSTLFDRTLPELQAAIASLGTEPTAYNEAFARLYDLQALKPDAPQLDELRDALAAAVTTGARNMGNAGQWNEAVDVTRLAQVNLPRSSALGESLATLEVERKHAVAEQEKRLVADAKDEVEKLLQDPVADRGWRASVRQKMEIIAALGEPGEPWQAENGRRIAALYVERATAMRNEQRLAEGANLLADAERFAPDVAGLAEERDALAVATEAFEAEQQEQARLARIDGLKQTFETQARANDVAKAAATLDALRSETAGKDDVFVTKDAPRMLARAYYKLATTRAAATDYAAALRFARACAELDKNRLECTNAVKDYTVSGNKQDIDKIIARGGDFDIAEVLAKISEIQVLDPGVLSKSEPDWDDGIAARLESLKEAVGTSANPIIQSAKELFEGNTVIASIDEAVSRVAPSPLAAKVNAAMDRALLGEARTLLKDASESENQHPEIIRLKARYNKATGEAKSLYETYKEQFRGKKYDDALATINNALDVYADSSTFKREKIRLVALIDSQSAKPIGGTDNVVEALPPLPPTQPCKPNLAGHGKRNKGTCFYFVSGKQPGPLMVVVPAGDAFSTGFAIGKYEVKVSDFNRYCKLSGDCQLIKGKDGGLPVTGITLDQAQAYVGWLTQRTGRKYRLPTAEEWTYAANAGGAQPKKDYNCRVEQNGQVLKGQGTMGVKTGKANGWGLYNYVGNAQEWVTSGGGVTVRGGAYEDTFSKCSIALEKTHNGGADTATGFRVLMELSDG